MIEWFLYQVPWWVWVGLGLFALALLHSTIGLRNTLIGLAGIASFGLLNRAGQKGYDTRARQEKEALDAQQEEWDRIERDRLTRLDAVERLRERSNKAGK